MTNSTNSPVSVHDEWSPLEEVIVGTALGARVPHSDKGQHTIRCSDLSAIPEGPIDPRCIAEAEEDIAGLISFLEDQGIKVRRPVVRDHSREYATPDWKSDGMHAFCPRDTLLAVGRTIIETPMSLRSRQYESLAYRPILHEYMNSGARWISAPKPELRESGYNRTDRSLLAVLEEEPVFDAANCLRLGRDILYLVSDSGNLNGATWLQSALGDSYRVHRCENIYKSTHIDTTIAALRPGLLLANPARLSEKTIPKVLRDWEVIMAPEPVDIGYSGYPFSSPWIGMNFLSISPELAVVEKSQTELIRILEKRGISCAPLPWRHGRSLGGGFHCATLDVRRTGNLENFTS
ncbi:inosamine-phosphate amidinotransferase 1 [Streptomyces sp. HB132]|uniref:inosamine-phosphate amidinotransferase 1 n=1 Tax=Streptomyces sp. HB132 TaxID=767388 RepID=UPI00195FFD49|nr:inosamine-phosphate amidinotransferase 1 [Streptomyces sp. HB132]MBM7440095.1 glycine amidinotransferase/scyllo-inosamine-4-phosphate amidinotransferase 1 [Streptomyces sp. HB132]